MSQETKQEKPPIWEIWRSIWSEMGTLEAIADALPESPAGATLRGYQEHGLPKILPAAEEALREVGLEPDRSVADKSYHRGYQITTLLIRKSEGWDVPLSEYQRDPSDFFAEVQIKRQEAERRRAANNAVLRPKEQTPDAT